MGDGESGADPVPNRPPAISRQEDWQTCFLCEMYCRTYAANVHPDCEKAVGLTPAEGVAAGFLGQFRRDSRWGEWRTEPRYRNALWLMDRIFGRARSTASGHQP